MCSTLGYEEEQYMALESLGAQEIIIPFVLLPSLVQISCVTFHGICNPLKRLLGKSTSILSVRIPLLALVFIQQMTVILETHVP